MRLSLFYEDFLASEKRLLENQRKACRFFLEIGVSYFWFRFRPRILADNGVWLIRLNIRISEQANLAFKALSD